ncbi:hypothetical protein B0O99DRAFT_694679 [Bisporella sp. PMI_857]|nr:hypothetical protein B0O99DRAFT_694679 [Bisporella sp. PMI_857]
MADSENHSTITVDDRPVAVRRERGISVGPNLRSRMNSQTAKPRCYSMSTPPATPKRSKKRVRFSDPRSETKLESVSSGLTPFIHRTTISTTPPPAGYHSAPTSHWNRGDYSIPISGTIQFESLRQVLDGRLKRG